MFEAVKDELVEHLKSSKLSALAVFFERLELSNQYTDYQFPTPDGSEAFLAFQGGSNPPAWVATLFMSYALGTVSLWPEQAPFGNGKLPYLITPIELNEPIVVLRNIAYDAETIKGVL